MNVSAYGETHIGLKRSDNQDSILLDKDINLYAVADGMGGHRGGAVASSTAIEALKTSLKTAAQSDSFSPEVSIKEAFQKANEQVYKKSLENQEELVGMGTTLVAATIWEDSIFFGNVGDSRAYLFRDSYLWRVTEDHSIINEQIKKGLLDEKKAPLLVETNIITRSIGFVPEVETDLFQKEINSGDLFLLCSDGLTEMVPDETICEILKSNPHHILVEKLINQAIDAGGNDNISIIVIAT